MIDNNALLRFYSIQDLLAKQFDKRHHGRSRLENFKHLRYLCRMARQWRTASGAYPGAKHVSKA